LGARENKSNLEKKLQAFGEELQELKEEQEKQDL